MVAAPVLVAALVAAPWLWQGLVPCAWLGVAMGLWFAPRLAGWRGETTIWLTAALSLAAAFHWAPAVLADSLRTPPAVGVAFTVPIVLWDAVRLALPFWFVARTVTDPRTAWLPAALVAAAAEAFVPGVFPWKLGYCQIAWPVLVQAADLLGAEAATFVLFAHAGVLVQLADWARHRLRPGGRRPRASVVPAGLAAILVAAANLTYGSWALSSWSARAAAAPQLRVGLVQVDPGREGAAESLDRSSREACVEHARLDLLCWPECSGGCYEQALDSFADPGQVFARSRDPLRGFRPLPAPACPLLFGGQIYEGYPERPRKLYRSAILVDGSERIVGRYHKRHLMPFGEYIPGDGWLPELRRHLPLEEDLDAGPEPTVLPLHGAARLGTLLCYEDMVPSAAASLVAGGASLLVSLINGASFTAPLTLEQHRLLAQLRAVENRRCLVRCAATGETCVIAPQGTITARLPLHAEGVLVADVPLLHDRTLANRLGPAFPAACAAAAGLMAAWRWRRMNALHAARRSRGA
jgi:apolipoprotein N-acyltransferase